MTPSSNKKKSINLKLSSEEDTAIDFFVGLGDNKKNVVLL